MSLHCPCNNFTEIPTGGLLAGGVASNEVENTGLGGVQASGTAVVWVVNDTYDGMAALWALDETSTGVADEFEDRTRNNLHGIGGSGDTNFLPTADTGVFCLPSQNFQNRDHISFPRDTITGSFSISLWVNLPSFNFGEKVFFSRGVRSSNHLFNFSIGTSYIGQLMARLVTTDGTFQAYSSEKMSIDRWSHVACTFSGSLLTLFIDGIDVGSVSVTGDPVAYLSGNHAYAAKMNNGSGFVGNLQEIRLFHEAKSDDYFSAEHDNFCHSDFVEVGSTIDEAVFTSQH